MSDNIYTIKEASEYLKVHWQTVRNYIRKGKLRSFKIGRNLRIRESDLRNFVKGKNPRKLEKEIEIRFATKNRKSIENKLIKSGAKVVYHGHIIDHWYVPLDIKNLEDKNKWFDSAKGFGLRIREQDNGYTGKITTSIEVKRLATPHDHQVCLESEVDVQDYEAANSLLRLMNYKKMAKLDKDRLVYKYKDVKVVIDDIKNFKTGIELESITSNDPKRVVDKLKNFAGVLGLDLKKEITDKSVTYLYMKKFSKF